MTEPSMLILESISNLLFLTGFSLEIISLLSNEDLLRQDLRAVCFFFYPVGLTVYEAVMVIGTNGFYCELKMHFLNSTYFLESLFSLEYSS